MDRRAHRGAPGGAQEQGFRRGGPHPSGTARPRHRARGQGRLDHLAEGVRSRLRARPTLEPRGGDMQSVLIHPLVVRVTHWINVLAVLIMITSGWSIYNASPLFPFEIPSQITLGGWLAGALQWHFAGMWLFALNGLVYLAYGIASGHLRRKLLPITPRAVLHDIREALRGHLAHDDLSVYNAAQRA